MKAFTFRNGKLTEGIKVIKDRNWGYIISLGLRGPYKFKEKLSFFKSNPPEIIENKLYDFYPLKMSRGYKEFFVLAKNTIKNDDRVIIRINTHAKTKKKYYHGTWEAIIGDAWRIVHAYGSFSQGPKIWTWDSF